MIVTFTPSGPTFLRAPWKSLRRPTLRLHRGPGHRPNSTTNRGELEAMTGPLLRIRGSAALVTLIRRKIRLNLRTKFVEALILDRAYVAYPALLTSTSSRPNSSFATATASRTCSFVTSSATSLSPEVSTASASARPRPRELPVIPTFIS